MSTTYALDDPRPIAASAPYTYYLPSDALLAAVGPGDLVKLLFRSLAESPEYNAERMWVRLQIVSSDHMVGVLDNEPHDLPGLKPGERIRFERHHVIDVLFADPEKDQAMNEQKPRQYWDRCLVDRCILSDDVPVGFIYRETPQPMGKNHKDPDSGWRIRGDDRGVTDAEFDAREAIFVALGAVLNRDDSWVALIDEPVGSAFTRDFDTNTYLPTSAISHD